MNILNKRILLIRLLFIVVFALIMNLSGKLLTLKTMHGSSQCLALYEQPKDTIDVVMLGSSHMHCDVNPAVLWENEGIASYVFSGAEQPLWVTYHYLIEFCKNQTPKLAVIDLYTPGYYRDYFRSDWLGENIYNLRFSINKIETIIDTCTWDQIDVFFPSFFGYHSRYSELEKKDFDTLLFPHEQQNFKGYVPGFSCEAQNMPCLGVTETMRMDKKSELYLHKIIDYAREHNIELFLVVNPYPSMIEHEKIFNKIREIADEEGVGYLNANYCFEEISLDPARDFNDDSHLNYYGGCKYSSFLAREIKCRYDIPDRRGDTRYVSWSRNVDLIKDKAVVEGWK